MAVLRPARTSGNAGKLGRCTPGAVQSSAVPCADCKDEAGDEDSASVDMWSTDGGWTPVTRVWLLPYLA